MKLLPFLLLLFCSITQAQQPMLVKEINDSGDSNPHAFVTFKGAMYFFASDENNEIAFYRTHGEASDVEKLASPAKNVGISPNSYFVFLTKNEDYLYFYVKSDKRFALLKTDGEKQFDYVFLPEKVSLSSSGNIAAATENKLYFVVNVYSTAWKNELWASDITKKETYKIKGVSSVGTMFTSHNNLYFNTLDKGSFKVIQDTIAQPSKDISYIFAQKDYIYGWRKLPNADHQIFRIDSLNQTQLLLTFKSESAYPLHSITPITDTSSVGLLVRDSILYAYEITPNQVKERAAFKGEINFYKSNVFLEDSLFLVSFIQGSATNIYSINLHTWNTQKLYESKKALDINRINQKGFYVLNTCFDIPCHPDQLLFYTFNSNSIDTLLSYYGLENITFLNDKVFFSYQYNLWVSNNQNPHGVFFKVFNSHNASSYPNSFMNIGKHLYFYAENKDNRRLFCRTDGTNQGTIASPYSKIFRGYVLGEINDKIIHNVATAKGEGFVAVNKKDSTQVELFYDTEDYIRYRAEILHFNNKDYLLMPKNVLPTIYSLWETDATKFGTRKVLELDPLSSPYEDYLSYVLFNHLYIVKKNSKIGDDATKIFKANVANDGTFALSLWKNAIPVHSSLIEFGNHIYFMSKKANLGDFEFNLMDPTTGAQKMLKTFIVGTDILDGSSPYLFKYNGIFYIAFKKNERDAPIYKLYTTDGIEVKLLINNELRFISSKNNKTNLVFFKTIDNKQETLWRTDGKKVNTFKISDTYDSIAEDIAFANDSTFYFLASSYDITTKINHRFLLQSNGKLTNTKVVLESKNMKWDLFNLAPLAILNNAFFFDYDNGKIGSELYKLPIANLVKTETILAEKEALEVFPNPALDEIQVRNPLAEVVLLRIYDINGREVKTDFLFDSISTINISSLLPGVYIFEISTKNSFFYKRVIKSR
jgi:hypothetical protein